MGTKNNGNRSKMDEDAIKNFREYLRIPSVHPNVNYDKCIEFLENQAKSLELPYKLYKGEPSELYFVISWVGKEPTLPSILLNSHMDVVPVFEDKWTYKPFDAHMDNEGNIYGRGTQDMKSVGIQYLEAIRRLKKEGVTCKRTIHLGFGSDEEARVTISGVEFFVKTKDFQQLNIGFELDEGIASTSDNIPLFYGERIVWPIQVHCTGQQGHGSLLLPHPPGNKIGAVITKFNNFRESQIQKLRDNPTLTLGDVITVNLTKLQGGVQANVVPPEFIATFDMRIPSTDFEKHLSDVEKWCKDIGEGVSIEHIRKVRKLLENTKIDESNQFWIAFKKALDDMKVPITPLIFPAGTDAQHIRALGIPALGFSPMTNTKIRLHDNDEYLNAKIFLKGIEIYTRIIPGIANV